MRKRSLWVSLVFMLFLLFALAACSKTDKTASNKEEGTKTETPKEEDKAPAKDTLIFGRSGDAKSLDPAQATDGESFKVTENIFNTLIDFGEQDTELKAGLAKEWTTSEDGLTYELTLQEGVKFHDGTDFNAEAVKANFERWMGGNEESFPYYFSQFGDIIKSVEAVDPLKVKFTLSRPLAPFLKNLAMSPFAISSPTAFEKDAKNYGRNPVGTGPFKFVEWKPNDRITLEKNEEYWVEGLPKLKSVIFRVIPENSARMNALSTGEVDLIDGVNYSDVPTIEGNKNLQPFFRPSFNTGYLGLNVEHGPLKDKKVRQALNHAIDKQALIDAFYAGEAQPAINPMPPVIAGYNDSVKDYEYDPAKAKELLKEAGYEDGFEITLWAMPVARDYMPDAKKVSEVIKKQFEEIGVKSKIVSYEWATYLEKLRVGEADAFLIGWTGDNGDADNFLYTLLDQDAIDSNNYARYKNEEVHKLLIEAQTLTDQNARNELYKRAQEIIKEDAPWVPLVHSKPVLAGAANISGYVPHPTGTEKLENVEFK